MARRKKSPAHRERRIQVYTTVRQSATSRRAPARLRYTRVTPRPLDGQAVFQHRTFKRVASHHGSRPTRRTPAAARRPAGATAATAARACPTDLPTTAPPAIGDSFTPHTLIIKHKNITRHSNLLLFICVCRHEKDRKMNLLCQA